MPEPQFDPRVVELLAVDRRRWTRRWLHRPASLASRVLVALICLLKRLLPFQFAAHGAMDRLCIWFLRRCVSPEAGELLVRHFLVETNLLNVLVDNAPGDLPRVELLPTSLAELLASGGPREAVFAAFLDELEQPLRRQVVVVEDAHWADEATLDLLVLLGRRLERTPAMLIVTYRDDELAAGHTLLMVLTSLPREAVRRLPLQPLTERATAELARQAGRPAAGVRA